jgi:hypothetical protein
MGRFASRENSMKKCTIESCPRPLKAHGMCGTHLYRHNNGLPLNAEIRQYERERICKLDGCAKLRESSGEWCDMHYRRHRTRGEVGSADRERAPFGEATWHDPDVSRAKKLRVQYGLTVEAYDEMLRRQGGGCAFCKRAEPGWSRARSKRGLTVDHDHETGHVRGLLCNPCNRGIGLLGDDPAVLEAAARYLRAARQIPLFGPAKSA